MPQAHTSPGPIQSLRAHAGRLMRQYTPPESGSLRHQGLMCTALSLVLITIFLGTYLAMGAGREVALGSGVAAVLMAGFVIDAILLLRFYACDPKAHRRLKELSWSSIALNSVLVGLLSLLMWGRDNEFYVLMIVPVLQAAIWLDLGGTAGVLLVSIFLNFLGAFPMDADEWAEAAAGSLIYALVAIVVWLLVNSLRDREARLKHNLEELARTRER